MSAKENTPWYVYLVQCADNTLYCGSCTNLEKRLHEHNNSKLGAKYTRTRRPVKLVYREQCSCRSSAYRLEANIKRLPASEKRRLALWSKGN